MAVTPSLMVLPGGTPVIVHTSTPPVKKDVKVKRSQRHDQTHGYSKAGTGPSKSSLKDKPEPRGPKQKTANALERRRAAFTGNSAGGHKQHMPGSQNRKKGAYL